MHEQFRVVAEYEEKTLAESHAKLLKRHNISSEVEELDIFDADEEKGWKDGDVLLKVNPDQFNQAFSLLQKMDDRRAESVAGIGDVYMLVGAIMAMVGMLTSMGNFSGASADLILFPYTLAALGGCIFLKGMIYGRDE
ncbi:hypothetical protein [Pontibacter sp. G13]|uniref:hypothetical protein n=1 Tax=Pontibacter sp. G13 TaxID=3074898 RepID=UPI00288A9A78|nr:hypothetical protein [Pontibacter sp. G13]WNJ17461.1 hypothetical protein RJD25_21650 [Pontibacter sp. G13]